MSEFSESYHLEATHQNEGITLLQEERLPGYVFPAENGWVTICPLLPYGEEATSLMRAASGTVVRYRFDDEDGGWMFHVCVDGESISRYTCQGDILIDIDADALDLDAIVAIADRHTDQDRRRIEETLRKALYPRLHWRTSSEGEKYQRFTDYAPEDLDNNPAYEFARVMGFTNFFWTSAKYFQKDPLPDGVVAVEKRSRFKRF